MIAAAAPTPQAKLELLGYLAQRIGCTPRALVGDMPFEMIAILARDGALKGAVLYTNYRSDSIEMTLAGEPGWIDRAGLRAAFAYPFEQLRCRRVSAIIARKNKAARRLAERCGFRLWGVIPGGPGAQDAMLYGMLAHECRWVAPPAFRP